MTIEEHDVLELLARVPRTPYTTKEIVDKLPQHSEENIKEGLKTLVTRKDVVISVRNDNSTVYVAVYGGVP
jgi:predicted transcriptional regulator